MIGFSWGGQLLQWQNTSDYAVQAGGTGQVNSAILAALIYCFWHETDVLQHMYRVSENASYMNEQILLLLKKYIYIYVDIYMHFYICMYIYIHIFRGSVGLYVGTQWEFTKGHFSRSMWGEPTQTTTMLICPSLKSNWSWSLGVVTVQMPPTPKYAMTAWLPIAALDCAHAAKTSAHFRDTITM